MTVGELVRGVGILLERTPLDECSQFDVDGDLRVAVNEIVAGVNNSLLSDCQSLTPCDATDAVDRALCYLAAGNLREANHVLAGAVGSTPNDARANLFYALTRITIPVFDDRSITSLIDRGQITIEGNATNVCDIDVALPDEVPATAPRSGEVIDTLRSVLLPELNGALDNVRRLPLDVNIRFPLRYLPSCVDVSEEVDVDEIEIDHADVLALETGLHALIGIVELASGYHLDASIQAAVDNPVQMLLAAEPALLTLRSAPRLDAARTALESALQTAVDAMDAMRSEQDNQDDDALVILPQDAEDADKGRRMFMLLRQALRGEVTLPIDVITGEITLMDIGLGTQERLNLDRLFSGQFPSLRHLLPAFDADGDFDTGAFPDPTFGGMAPDLTQDKIDNFFSEASYF